MTLFSLKISQAHKVCIISKTNELLHKVRHLITLIAVRDSYIEVARSYQYYGYAKGYYVSPTLCKSSYVAHSSVELVLLVPTFREVKRTVSI